MFWKESLPLMFGSLNFYCAGIGRNMLGYFPPFQHSFIFLWGCDSNSLVFSKTPLSFYYQLLIDYNIKLSLDFPGQIFCEYFWRPFALFWFFSIVFVKLQAWYIHLLIFCWSAIYWSLARNLSELKVCSPQYCLLKSLKIDNS